jgi:hypothetical protein
MAGIAEWAATDQIHPPKGLSGVAQDGSHGRTQEPALECVESDLGRFLAIHAGDVLPVAWTQVVDAHLAAGPDDVPAAFDLSRAKRRSPAPAADKDARDLLGLPTGSQSLGMIDSRRARSRLARRERRGRDPGLLANAAPQGRRVRTRWAS